MLVQQDNKTIWVNIHGNDPFNFISILCIVFLHLFLLSSDYFCIFIFTELAHVRVRQPSSDRDWISEGESEGVVWTWRKLPILHIAQVSLLSHANFNGSVQKLLSLCVMCRGDDCSRVIYRGVLYLINTDGWDSSVFSYSYLHQELRGNCLETLSQIRPNSSHRHQS